MPPNTLAPSELEHLKSIPHLTELAASFQELNKNIESAKRDKQWMEFLTIIVAYASLLFLGIAVRTPFEWTTIIGVFLASTSICMTTICIAQVIAFGAEIDNLIISQRTIKTKLQEDLSLNPIQPTCDLLEILIIAENTPLSPPVLIGPAVEKKDDKATQNTVCQPRRPRYQEAFQ